ncbi:PREDICTED: transcription factor BIM2-like [Tarenaya hassleriana]|uniref:transcription factor BIM2-like n=1 Tax=Tarenaya hassleriana TaxID=28532 RepID=UPI00053C2E11|nr:PREDICTED: transcription factor BIM2-like [Tarenaya hassleriana]
MRIGKGNLDEEEYGDDEFGPNRHGPSSNTTVHSNNNSIAAANKDAKNSDKAAIRSKHSVTEQRRRSKINERFQILRELIPHSDQKRDTASFLVEVCYVGLDDGKWESPSRGSLDFCSRLVPVLISWFEQRNSHWRVQGFADHPNNGSGPGTPFHGKFEENNNMMTATTPAIQNPVESEHDRDVSFRPTDRQPELDNKGLSLSMSVAPIPQLSHSHGGAQSIESPARGSDLPCQQPEDPVIEGGTINISSVYSHELLTSLTQALEKAGVDLSHARLSVQIDLGKRSDQGVASANKDPESDNEGAKDPGCCEEESDHSYKRMKKT